MRRALIDDDSGAIPWDDIPVFVKFQSTLVTITAADPGTRHEILSALAY